MNGDPNWNQTKLGIISHSQKSTNLENGNEIIAVIVTLSDSRVKLSKSSKNFFWSAIRITTTTKKCLEFYLSADLIQQHSKDNLEGSVNKIHLFDGLSLKSMMNFAFHNQNTIVCFEKKNSHYFSQDVLWIYVLLVLNVRSISPKF